MKDKKFRLYEWNGNILFRYKKSGLFLYRVEIFKHISELNGSYRVELFDNGEFETSEFIGLELNYHKKSSDPKINFSKDISLLAVPDEFIEKHQIKQVEDANQRKSKLRSNRGRKSKNGNSKTGI